MGFFHAGNRSEESSRLVVFHYVLSHIHLIISLAQEMERRGPLKD